jgi:hypothetical protein
MMASQPPSGPDTEEREAPGDTQANPSGASTDEPAEGGDDLPGREPGSPEG